MLNTKITYLKHSQLIPSETNRSVKRSTENTKARAATIKHIGAVIQNIVVTPAADNNGKYIVHAGNGRYDSVELLIKQGDATPDFEYPALIADSDSNLQSLIKLAENSNRDALHPVDEFLTYQSAIDEGNTIKTIANANGVTQKYVKQRMKLAGLSPVILNALRADEIDLDAAEAYTLADDHEEQEGVFNALSHFDKSNEYAIRNAIKNESVTQSDSVAKFVGRDAYKKAGGTITTDLFSTTEYWNDKALVFSLADDKLQQEAEKLQDQWGWVETTSGNSFRAINATGFLAPTGYDIPQEIEEEEKRLEAEYDDLESKPYDDFTEADEDRMRAIEDRLDAIEQQREENPIYSPEEQALAGCIIAIGHNGQLVIEKGRIKAEDRAELKALRSTEGEEQEEEQGVSVTQEDEATGYSQALRSDLADTRTAIIQATVAASPEAAYDLGVFTLADSVLRDGFAGYSPRATNLSVQRNFLEGADDEAIAYLDRVKQGLDLSWTHGNGAERFAAFCALNKSKKAAIFAYCVSVGIGSELAGSRSESEALAATVERVQPNYRGAWTPTKDTFFKRIPKTELVEIGSEVFGAEWAEGNSNSKKGDLVSEMASAFHRKLDLQEDQQERVNQWTPKGF